jgi:hypothetical protein
MPRQSTTQRITGLDRRAAEGLEMLLMIIAALVILFVLEH